MNKGRAYLLYIVGVNSFLSGRIPELRRKAGPMKSSFFFHLLFFPPILAGCLEETAPEMEPELPGHAEFANCDFTYPDGTPIPCTNQLAPVELEAGPPDRWTCVAKDSSSSPSWKVYRTVPVPAPLPPVADEIGLWYELQSPGAPVIGAVRFSSEGRVSVVNFSGATSGFIRLGDFRAGHTAGFLFDAYHLGYETNLSGARFEVLWSERRANEFWQIHELHLADHSYFFQRMETLDGESYFPVGFLKEGVDFRLQATSQSVFRGGPSDDALIIDRAQTDC